MRYYAVGLSDDRPPQCLILHHVRDSHSRGLSLYSTIHEQEAIEFAALMNATDDMQLMLDLMFDVDARSIFPPVEREPKHFCGHCRRALMYVGPCWSCREAIEQGETDGRQEQRDP